MKYFPIICAKCGLDTAVIGKGGAYAYVDKWLCEKHIPSDILEAVKVGAAKARDMDVKRYRGTDALGPKSFKLNG